MYYNTNSSPVRSLLLAMYTDLFVCFFVLFFFEVDSLVYFVVRISQLMHEY